MAHCPCRHLPRWARGQVMTLHHRVSSCLLVACWLGARGVCPLCLVTPLSPRRCISTGTRQRKSRSPSLLPLCSGFPLNISLGTRSLRLQYTEMVKLCSLNRLCDHKGSAFEWGRRCMLLLWISPDSSVSDHPHAYIYSVGYAETDSEKVIFLCDVGKGFSMSGFKRWLSCRQG